MRGREVAGCPKLAVNRRSRGRIQLRHFFSRPLDSLHSLLTASFKLSEPFPAVRPGGNRVRGDAEHATSARRLSQRGATTTDGAVSSRPLDFRMRAIRFPSLQMRDLNLINSLVAGSFLTCMTIGARAAQDALLLHLRAAVVIVLHDPAARACR